MTEPHTLTQTDNHETIQKIIQNYKRQHDRDAFLYKYIANSIPMRVLMKMCIPWLSKTFVRWRERVRVNKII